MWNSDKTFSFSCPELHCIVPLHYYNAPPPHPSLIGINSQTIILLSNMKTYLWIFLVYFGTLAPGQWPVRVSVKGKVVKILQIKRQTMGCSCTHHTPEPPPNISGGTKFDLKMVQTCFHLQIKLTNLCDRWYFFGHHHFNCIRQDT